MEVVSVGCVQVRGVTVDTGCLLFCVSLFLLFIFFLSSSLSRSLFFCTFLTANMAPGSAHPALFLIFIIFCLCGSVYTFEQDDFIIGAYSEPPFGDEMEATYQQMAQAGFNMVKKSPNLIDAFYQHCFLILLSEWFDWSWYILRLLGAFLVTLQIPLSSNCKFVHATEFEPLLVLTTISIPNLHGLVKTILRASGCM